MSQQEIEVILARYLAEYLAMSIMIVDPEGDLLYYNEPAEAILGHRYDETGPMPASEWSTKFQPEDHEGRPIKPEDLPLMIATTKQHPAHESFWIRGLDQTRRQIEVTAFPLTAQGQRFLGAIAIFWEVAK
ncbi:MAG: PAS domain-containing protein [Anaerolineales bacterium]|jgi:PAS domain-containing protein|nr:PAS domain-containing protein [Anaerolineales bacterium]MCK5314786.1 PAS domain-containing protein [Anaerolineales bacterium]MCK5428563.1 PAS domain-containing protein [Anaerolineales bacterium]